MAKPLRNDPRIPDTIKHLKILARRHNRRLVVQDYLEYRARHAPDLPALTTVYRIFGSWPDALQAAGVERHDKTEQTRTSYEQLVAALNQAADGLGVKVLSSHAYDEYRKTQAPNLPSSSVIRKWLGRWAEAVKMAGLETTERAAPRRLTMAEIIGALRDSKDKVDGMLTPRRFAEYRASLPEEDQEAVPDLSQIMNHFPNWEAALLAADVEQSDTLHPSGLWTAEEARRIYRQVEKVLGRAVDKKGYEFVRENSKKPMPSWDVMNDLLSA